MRNDVRQGSRRTALDAALGFLTRRSHGRAELAAKLRRRGFSLDEVEAALARVVELGYVDDRDTARRAARSLLERRKGLRAVEAWLRGRGFESDTIREIVADEGLREAEVEACRQALERLDDDEDRLRLAARLRGRGFRDETVEKVVWDRCPSRS